MIIELDPMYLLPFLLVILVHVMGKNDLDKNSH